MIAAIEEDVFDLTRHCEGLGSNINAQKEFTLAFFPPTARKKQHFFTFKKGAFL
jgi:hypothetical protein